MATKPTLDDVDANLASQFIQLTDKEHAKQKSMHLGSHKVAGYDIYTYHSDTKKFQYGRQQFSQVFYKMFDEIIVNAMDVATKYNSVKVINITMDKSSGEIMIHNDGKIGIPCGIVKTANGDPIYLPEMLYTHFRAGSNHSECKKSSDNTDHISTGTNGLGCKLVTVNSSYIKIDTHDLERKIHYVQEIHNGMEVIDPPQITKLKGGRGTTITYRAQWSTFKGWGKWDQTVWDVMEPILHARIMFASVYLGIPIGWNGINIQLNDATQLAKYFVDNTIQTTIKPKTKPTGTFKIYPWDICCGIGNDPVVLSVVNGACVSGGQHLDHIIKQIVEYVKPQIEKMFKKSKTAKYQKRMITNYLSIVMVGVIPNIEFDSQLKTKLVCPDDFVQNYNLGKPFLKSIWEALEPILHEQYMVVAPSKSTRKTLVSRNKDYEPAIWAGKPNKETYLFPIEGHSAASMVRRCLLSDDVKGLSFKNCGLYCLGGVTSNVHGHVEIMIGKDGKRKVIMDAKIKEAPKFNAFMKILNLDPTKDYTSIDDIKTLTYTKIVFITDADVDGIGNICGIALSNIQLLWPGLFQHGVIYRLSTPVQRWYPSSSKERVINFYTDQEARTWMEKNTKGGKLKYFKGLATHSNEDAINIFQSFFELLTVYRTTPNSSTITDHIFGKDPTMRKIYHSTKADMNDPELNKLFVMLSGYNKTPLEVAIEDHVLPEPTHKTGIEKSMTVEHHMLTYSMEYQMANNDRSLPHAIDGLLRTHRKCVHGGMMRKGEIKVFQMGGYIAMSMAYHHGSASIEGVLVKLAQCFPGANNIPLFLPLGQFGSRNRGGKDAGSSRYISTDINPICRWLFREEDRYILPYTPEDGEIVEPDYLCPVFPHVANIHHDNIAHAWYCGTIARDHQALYKNVLNMINGDDVCPMPPGLNNWHGEVVNVGGVEYTKGSYVWDDKKEVLHITELPFQKWNESYIYSKNGVASKEWVSKVEDYSSDENIDIKIYLKPGAMATIMKKFSGKTFDPVTECFKLYSACNICMNFIGTRGETLHFTKYEDMIQPWFTERKRLYHVRIERQKIIVQLEIRYMENLIRFIENYKTMNVATGKDESEADAFLYENKFDRFDKPLLENPKFTPLDKISTLVLGGPNAGYEYIKSAHHPNKRTPTACKANKDKLATLKAELDKISQPQAWSQIWLSELDEYLTVYKRESAKGWVPKKKY